MTTGTTRSSAGLDPRRRAILYRAWHRGMREMDLVMGRFADAMVESLDEREMDALERLMDAPDPEIFAWVIGQKPVPAAYDDDLFARLKQFHRTRTAPLS